MANVYLKLFHGRKHPGEDLDDWGSDGPLLGPFNRFHFTYISGTIQANREIPGEAHDLVFLTQYEDLIFYDGVFYGDMVISTLRDCDQEVTAQYDEAKAILPDEFQKPSKANANQAENEFKCDNCNFIVAGEDPGEILKLSGGDMKFCKECVDENKQGHQDPENPNNKEEENE